MTDNDIIKALDVLKSWQKLAYHNDDGTDEDSHELYIALTIIFEYINRQKAEIERLNEELRKVQFDYLPIDALMDEFCSAANYNDYGKITLLHIGDIVDRVRRSQLVKETKKVESVK